MSSPPPVSEDILNDLIALNYFQRGTITIFAIMVMVAIFNLMIQTCRAQLDRNLLQDDQIKRYQFHCQKDNCNNKDEYQKRNTLSSVNLRYQNRLEDPFPQKKQQFQQAEQFKIQLFYCKNIQKKDNKEDNCQQSKQPMQANTSDINGQATTFKNRRVRKHHRTPTTNNIGMVFLAKSSQNQKQQIKNANQEWQNNINESINDAKQQGATQQKKRTLSFAQGITKALFQTNYFFSIKMFWLINFICGTNYGFSFILFFVLLALKVLFFMLSMFQICEKSIIPKILDQTVWVFGALLWAINLWSIQNPIFQFAIQQHSQ